MAPGVPPLLSGGTPEVLPVGEEDLLKERDRCPWYKKSSIGAGVGASSRWRGQTEGETSGDEVKDVVRRIKRQKTNYQR